MKRIGRWVSKHAVDVTLMCMCNMAQPLVASSTVFGFKICPDFEVAKSTSAKLIQGLRVSL